MKKKQLISDGMYVYTKTRRNAGAFISLSTKELEEILKEAKKRDKKYDCHFIHLSPDVSFFFVKHNSKELKQKFTK